MVKICSRSSKNYFSLRFKQMFFFLFSFQILILGDSEPRSKFVDFLLAQPTMGNFSENCSGSECLAKPNGFYSGNIPWIGLPSSIQVNNKSDLIEFSCLVSDENLELSFTHENNGKILEASSISVGVANDLKIVKFSLRLLEIFIFDCTPSPQIRRLPLTRIFAHVRISEGILH